MYFKLLSSYDVITKQILHPCVQSKTFQLKINRKRKERDRMREKHIFYTPTNSNNLHIINHYSF